jgi:hypothetical protein
VEPVDLKPIIISRPPSIDSPNCTQRSLKPSWRIYSVDAHQATEGSSFTGDQRIGNASFTLINSANNYSLNCQLIGPELNLHSNQPFEKPVDFDRWFSCTPANPHSAPKYVLTTTVQLNRKTNKFAVNQTWFCNDEGDDHP